MNGWMDEPFVFVLFFLSLFLFLTITSSTTATAETVEEYKSGIQRFLARFSLSFLFFFCFELGVIVGT